MPLMVFFSYCSLSSDGCCTGVDTKFKLKLLKELFAFQEFNMLSKIQLSWSACIPFDVINSWSWPGKYYFCFTRYGLKEFLVIYPAEDTEAVNTESKCHLLLSSISIAATNSKWYASSMYYFNQKDNFLKCLLSRIVWTGNWIEYSLFFQ